MREPFGLILAGDRGTRVGNVSKADLTLGHLTLLAHVQARLEPQVAAIVVNANGPIVTDLPVIADATPDHLGPLAAFWQVLIGPHAKGARTSSLSPWTHHFSRATSSRVCSWRGRPTATVSPLRQRLMGCTAPLASGPSPCATTLPRSLIKVSARSAPLCKPMTPPSRPSPTRRHHRFSTSTRPKT